MLAPLRSRDSGGRNSQGPAASRIGTIHAHPVGVKTSCESIEVEVASLAAAPGAVHAAVALLSDDERHRARRFVFERDRRRFILARARLRELLGERLGTRADSIEFEYNAHGKPALSRRFTRSDLQFSVSHCDDVATYAFARGGAIGIDVEAVRPVSEADDIAARCFSRREYAAYRMLTPSERALGFCNCWTRKEAFVKALGDGLSIPLDRFDVTLAPGESARVLRIDNTPGDSGWRLDSFRPAAGYVAAIARRG